MRRFVTEWVAALAVIAFALMPVAAATAASEATFVSKLYRYSLVLPGSASRWQAIRAQVGWSAGVIDPGLPAFDTFIELQTQRAYVIGARRLPAGATLEKWTSFVISERPPACHAAPAGRPRRSTLSRAPAHLFTFSCTDAIAVLL